MESRHAHGFSKASQSIVALCNPQRQRAHNQGQSTVEFCVVFVALLGLLFAGYEMYRFIQSGTFVAHAEASAPYTIAKNALYALADIFIH